MSFVTFYFGAGWSGGVGVSLHGPCVMCWGPPADQFAKKTKLLCCYAISMLVLLGIVCPHRQITSNNQDERHYFVCFKLGHEAKLSEHTQHMTLHSTLASVIVWIPAYVMENREVGLRFSKSWASFNFPVPAVFNWIQCESSLIVNVQCW